MTSYNDVIYSRWELLEAAAQVLASRFGREIDLIDPEDLESQNSVVRARVSSPKGDLPATVIVKHVTDEKFDLPEHSGPPSRFLNEWAALEFLTGLGAEVAPKLIGADRSVGLIILEDLGELATLERLLFDDGEEEALRGLEETGRLLGQLHSIASGREDDFLSIQTHLGTRSPLSDSTNDQRGRRTEFAAALDAMGVVADERFWDEVLDLEALVHDDSLFRSLIHADAGPQNVLMADKDSRLIDFEFAVYGNALCDVVGARLGFPQTMGAGGVPRSAVGRLEGAYRDAAAEGIPQVEDTVVFKRHLTAASGHWALNRWANAWWAHLGPIDADEEPTDDAVRAMRSVWLVVDGFLAASGESGQFQVVADALGEFREAAVERWPGLEPSPVYPALAESVTTGPG